MTAADLERFWMRRRAEPRMPVRLLSRPALTRALLRPRVLAPVLVAALALGAFLGYGAWTRSRPVHYARGGTAFAVIPSTTPTGAAPAAPSATSPLSDRQPGAAP